MLDELIKNAHDSINSEVNCETPEWRALYALLECVKEIAEKLEETTEKAERTFYAMEAVGRRRD
jgi:hypothetical protein